ncbi:MAG: YidC/Oxa1 family insertase periplasmic-domain containing protein [candidate division WOR-3 bacterium]
MNDNLRLIIAFILVMLVLFVWQLLVPKPHPVASPSQPKPEMKTESTATNPVTNPLDLTAITSAPPIKETILTLENAYLKLTVSNYNAQIKSAYLKRYHAELVDKEISLITDSAPRVYNVIYQDPQTIIFQDRGLQITYQLDADYTLTVSISAPGESKITFDYTGGLALTEKNPKDELRHFSVFYHHSARTNKKGASRLKPTELDSITWAGLRSKYFTSILSIKPSWGKIKIMPLADGRIGYSLVTAAPNTLQAKMYFGPLDYELLRRSRDGWETVMDLGWTKVFSIAILKLIKFLYSLVKNYGVAIIIFALLMKGIFYPLTRMSTKQMRQMQLLQPKLEELKRRYKDDPQALNRETMQLYRLYKINPFTGCLPLLFQLPIFWALYSVLQRAIELRGARFVFWIKDLSLKDPYYILPILMGGSFLIQNFLSSADRRNMALLIFMPIFLTVIFLNFPSGLQLYWFIFNLLSIFESIIASKGGSLWTKTKTLAPKN